jgi:hypothetical protein
MKKLPIKPAHLDDNANSTSPNTFDRPESNNPQKYRSREPMSKITIDVRIANTETTVKQLLP